MTAGFNWEAFEGAVADGVASAVRSVVAGDPDERFYAAGLGDIYRETDRRIGLPLLAIDSLSAREERGDDEDEPRWSLADWGYVDDAWLPATATKDW